MDKHAQCQIALKAVTKHPNKTTLELHKITGIDRHLLGRRMIDLLNRKTIKRGDKRPCTASPSRIMSYTWEVNQESEK